MRGPTLFLSVLTNLIAFLLFYSLTYSAEWRISPIRVELSPQDKSASITVFNEDKHPINFQVKAMEWTQDEKGKDNYKESEDIIFFPKVFTIEPGKERLIRIGIKNINPSKERTYRLFVEEVPQTDRKNGVAVQIALRFGVPIFIKPLKEETNWEIIKKSVEKGSFVLEIQNKGNHHFNILYVKIRGISKENPEKELFTKEIKGWYILSGTKRIFTEKLEECEKLSSINFQIVTDRFSFDDKILLTNESCNP
ncbi:MAG: fimbria/pilus periplasmic chaperone [Proteobacteria bacterium]|nr:fimbria/pilus periplasmic chaperone [Pseudomonadota bacterium]